MSFEIVGRASRFLKRSFVERDELETILRASLNKNESTSGERWLMMSWTTLNGRVVKGMHNAC